jgi:hypothetical protein
MKIRYCPNCQHRTAQEKGRYFFLEDGSLVESLHTKYALGYEGFLCLTCGYVLIEQTETKTYQLTK